MQRQQVHVAGGSQKQTTPSTTQCKICACRVAFQSLKQLFTAAKRRATPHLLTGP